MQFKRQDRAGIAQLPFGSAVTRSPEPDALCSAELHWQPVPGITLVLWLPFYAFFLLYAALDRSGFLLIDYVNLPIHEGGHLLFGAVFGNGGAGGGFGETMTVAGGTILQLAAPLLLGIYFARQRQIPGTAFCSFFFFENFLNISTYMADARRQQLTLVTVGDGVNVIHDWLYLFSHMGVLRHDQQIAGFVRMLGWLGMIGTMLWLAGRARTRSPSQA